MTRFAFFWVLIDDKPTLFLVKNQKRPWEWYIELVQETPQRQKRLTFPNNKKMYLATF
jgi:hypothetical protein